MIEGVIVDLQAEREPVVVDDRLDRERDGHAREGDRSLPTVRDHLGGGKRRPIRTEGVQVADVRLVLEAQQRARVAR